jgi:tetraacyldisaccharide 4'-kinase
MTPARFHALVRGETRGAAAGLARLGLRLAALPYGLAVRLRNRLYDRGWKTVRRAGVPVVSVGNLTLGGTGKTPCVEYVARFYADLGKQVAILSRGYGSAAGRNDEAMVLEENLPDVPHLQGADRAALAATAVEELETEVLVLDDGFQHRRLHRDLDIVLADATWPLANERLFPAGTLREPGGGLRRAGVVLLTRCDAAGAVSANAQRDWLRRRFPALPVHLTEHRPLELIGADGSSATFESLGGRPVAAVCGIGNPAAFRRTLEGLGFPPADFREFPDHHPYTRVDVDELRRWAAGLPADAAVLTTQKDLVKLRLPDLAGRPVWAVRIGFRFLDGETEFAGLLRGVLGE